MQPVTRLSLKTLELIIGPESPIEEGALRRLKRLGLLDAK
jgi:hypothetical protein